MATKQAQKQWTAHKHTKTDQWYVKDENGDYLLINLDGVRARIIASAPEMVDALRSALALTWLSSHRQGQEPVLKLREAVSDLLKRIDAH